MKLTSLRLLFLLLCLKFWDADYWWVSIAQHGASITESTISTALRNVLYAVYGWVSIA